MVDSEDKINLLSNVLSNKLKSIENIESLKIYMTKMPEINLVKLGFLQNYDVSKFKYYALSSLMSKGYQYADYLTIINELFDKSNSKEELEDKLYKYPNKEFNYIDTAKKLDISEEEVKKKIKSLADSILKKEGTKSSSYATTMAMCLLEAGQDNIDNLPSIHNFMFGYTTQQEYQEIYNRCEKILQTTKEYSKEEMEIALRICFANYEKNDVENAVKLFITDIPAKKLYISSKKLGFFTIQELNESIKKSFFDLVNKKIIKKTTENFNYFHERANKLVLAARFKSDFDSDLQDLILINTQDDIKVRNIWLTNKDYKRDLQKAKDKLAEKGYPIDMINNIIPKLIQKSENQEQFFNNVNQYVHVKFHGLGYENQIEADEIPRGVAIKLADAGLSDHFKNRIIDIIKVSQKNPSYTKDKFVQDIADLTTEDNIEKLIDKYQKQPDSLPNDLSQLIMP